MRGIHYFPIFALKIDCRYLYNEPSINVLRKNNKRCLFFICKIVIFTTIKIPNILHRRVNIMHKVGCKGAYISGICLHDETCFKRLLNTDGKQLKWFLRQVVSEERE